MQKIIAVDPGASGAIAVRDQDGVRVYAMPETRGDTIELMRQLIGAEASETRAYVEKIHGYIPNGGPAQMFQFGRAVERAGCILEVLGVPIVEVLPKVWQETLRLGKSERKKAPRGATAKERAAVRRYNEAAKRKWKNKLKAEAQRRFPALKVTLTNCDALLILEAAQTGECG